MEMNDNPSGSGESSGKKRRRKLSSELKTYLDECVDELSVISEVAIVGLDAPPRQVDRVDVDTHSVEESNSNDESQPFLLVKPLENDDQVKNYYTQRELVGEGMNAKTYEVFAVDNPDIRLAMKVEKKTDDFPQRSGQAGGELLRLHKELLILNRILPKHKNVVELKDMLISPTNVYTVQELCAKRTMKDFFNVADANSGRRIFKQLVDAVEFIHQYGVVHNDLQPENVLFADYHFMECKVIDFGNSVYSPDWATKTHNMFNPNEWFADGELDPPDDVKHLEDVKCLGKLLQGIMAGKHVPFAFDNSFIEMKTKYKPRMEIFDAAALHLLHSIGPSPFGPDRAEDFLTVEQIVQHPWLTGENPTQLFRVLDGEFSLLLNDLRALSRLLKDYAIAVSLTVLETAADLASHFFITGHVQRGGADSHLLECERLSDNLGPWNNPIEMEKHAMKVLNRLDQSMASADEVARESLRIYNELLITLRILPRHEHIVAIDDVLLSREFVVVVREICRGHTLAEFLPIANNNTACRIFKQLADTVRFLHLYGVVHMDLNCHNIVFEDLQFNVCKIEEFTDALYIPALAQQSHEHFHLQAGRWFPPELLLMASNASPEVDIRALGRILHAMMTGIWQEDPSLSGSLSPKRGVFDDRALDLLSKIGPPPFGPAFGQSTLTIDEICLHPWFSRGT